jgi:hypothetical protein
MLSFRFPYPDMSCLKRSGDGIIEGWPLALTVNKDSSNSMHVYAKEEKVPRKRRRDKVWELWEVLFVIFFTFVILFTFFCCFFSLSSVFLLYWCFRPCRWWILNLLVPQTTGAAPVSSFNQLQTSCPENRRKREQLLLFLPEGIRFTALA